MVLRHTVNDLRGHMGDHLDLVSNVLLGISIVFLIGLGTWFVLKAFKRRGRSR